MNLLKSNWFFFWGILRRFYYWAPVVLLDSLDVYDRYVKWSLPEALRDINLPFDLAPAILAALVGWAALRTYHELRVQTVRLEERVKPKLDMVFDPQHYPSCLMENPVRDPSNTDVIVGTYRLFRVGIVNRGMETVHNVKVSLESSEPAIFPYTPVPLHFMHDNYSNGQKSRDGFSINPGDDPLDYVDVVHRGAILQQRQVVTFCFADNSLRNSATEQLLDVTLLAEGRDVAPSRRRFVVSIDEANLLEFHPAPNSPQAHFALASD